MVPSLRYRNLSHHLQTPARHVQPQTWLSSAGGRLPVEANQLLSRPFSSGKWRPCRNPRRKSNWRLDFWSSNHVRRPRIRRTETESSAFPHTGWLRPSLRQGPITFSVVPPRSLGLLWMLSSTGFKPLDTVSPSQVLPGGPPLLRRPSSAAGGRSQRGNRRQEHGSSASVPR